VWEDLVPKEKNIIVHEGQVVNKGESVVDGPADPQDILRLLGIEELARYIVDEVQDVYRLQGVKINDKHIEVIVRQMLRRVVIDNVGESNYIRGEQVERSELYNTNDALRAANASASLEFCDAFVRDSLAHADTRTGIVKLSMAYTSLVATTHCTGMVVYGRAKFSDASSPECVAAESTVFALPFALSTPACSPQKRSFGK
jgi:hypothetical protein